MTNPQRDPTDDEWQAALPPAGFLSASEFARLRRGRRDDSDDLDLHEPPEHPF